MQTTFFYPGRFLKKFADDQYSSIIKKQYLLYQPYVHTTFYHSSGLTRNWVFNGSIYVLYLQIPRFYLGRQKCIGRCNICDLLQHIPHKVTRVLVKMIAPYSLPKTIENKQFFRKILIFGIENLQQTE